MINLPGCIVLPPGIGKIFQIRKILRLQLFPMTPYIVLVDIKVVRNYVINYFKLQDQLSRIQSFHSQESLKMAKKGNRPNILACAHHPPSSHWPITAGSIISCCLPFNSPTLLIHHIHSTQTTLGTKTNASFYKQTIDGLGNHPQVSTA